MQFYFYWYFFICLIIMYNNRSGIQYERSRSYTIPPRIRQRSFGNVLQVSVYFFMLKIRIHHHGRKNDQNNQEKFKKNLELLITNKTLELHAYTLSHLSSLRGVGKKKRTLVDIISLHAYLRLQTFNTYPKIQILPIQPFHKTLKKIS